VPEQRATSHDAVRRPPGRLDQEELTGRELEIAALVALGLPNRDIAERLFISRRTVDAHINHIFGKLGLSSRVQLAIWARDRFGDLPPNPPLPSALPPSALPRSGHA
jgi:DNA-binding NarL/FixJ family response regulator